MADMGFWELFGIFGSFASILSLFISDNSKWSKLIHAAYSAFIVALVLGFASYQENVQARLSRLAEIEKIERHAESLSNPRNLTTHGNMVGRIWWEELSHWLCRRGEEEGVVAPRPGAVNVIQRFDSALRLNVHFHTLVLSGVYAGEGEEALFHELSAPTPDDLALILHKICFRLMDYLVRQGLLDPNGQPEADDHGLSSDEGLPAEFVAAAVAGRSVLGAEASSSWAARLESDPQAEVAFPPDKRSVQVSGFTLYVSPSIAPCARDRPVAKYSAT